MGKKHSYDFTSQYKAEAIADLRAHYQKFLFVWFFKKSNPIGAYYQKKNKTEKLELFVEAIDKIICLDKPLRIPRKLKKKVLATWRYEYLRRQVNSYGFDLDKNYMFTAKKPYEQQIIQL